MPSLRPVSSRQLLIAFAAALVLLAANAGISLRAIGNVQNLQQRIAHTLRVKSELRNLVLNLLEMESAQRGYLLTDRPIFREPTDDARVQTETSLETLRVLVRDNPEQTHQLGRLIQHVGDRVTQIERVDRAHAEGGNSAARDLVGTERGKMLMDSVMAVADRMEAHEDQLLQERQTAAADAQRDLSATIGVATVLALGLIFGIYLLIRGDLRRRESEARYIRTLNEQLDARVTERTRDLGAANATLKQTIAELGRSNRELQDFAFVASHDLQEPLRKIRTFADLLREEHGPALPDEAQHYLDRMHEAASRMSRLISDLLAFSRLSTRARPFTRVALGTVVREALDDLDVTLRETGTSVEVGTLPTIEADEGQLRQVFQNLIGNAIKFRRDGVPARVSVRSVGLDAEGRVVIEVADNGIGFDEKYLTRIFTPFQRLHTRGEYPGTGIGLAIVRKVIERHGGGVTARSTPGAGTTFVLALPAEQAAPDDASRALAPVSPGIVPDGATA